MNSKAPNPYESPESSESGGNKRKISLLTIMVIVVLLGAAGTVAAFITSSATSNHEFLLRRAVPVDVERRYSAEAPDPGSKPSFAADNAQAPGEK